ncbi:MAG: L,D-transpeptidase [Jatrophihabitantaceae bacterium]
MSRTVPPRQRAGVHRPAASHPRGTVRQKGWAGFVDRYGWRAYALPILTVISIVALTLDNNSSAQHTAVAAARTPSPATPTTSASAAGSGRATGVRVEGRSAGEQMFQAGSTPAPVVITLGSDAPTSCAANSYPQLILVSISKQHLWACDGAVQVNDTPVTTGAVTGGDQTPLGSWRVQAKQRDRYLVGPGYDDHVQYWVPYDGDFGLHDASWQAMPFGSQDWRTGGSHGCVHTPTATMQWLYRWAKVDSTVVTIES